MRRQTRAGAALILGGLLALIAGPSALASQGGEDHKITLCHRTHSDTNPYVTITVDKASVFKRGHDTHDEGGVWEPGLKDAGLWWGDIIPAFDYYASPKAEQTSHYAGLNLPAGQVFLDNGCKALTPSTPPVTTTTTPPVTTSTTTPVTTPVSTTPETTAASTTPPGATSTTAEETTQPPVTTTEAPPGTSRRNALPHTGGPGALLPVAALGMVAIGSSLLLVRRRPRRH